MKIPTVLLVLAVLVQARPIEAQSHPRSPEAPNPSVQVIQALRGGSDVPLWPDRILTTVAAGVLGAGLGFFASQVVRGDWDDGPGQPSMNRPLWAVVGGSVGLAVGVSFSLPSRAPPRPPRHVLPPRGSVITAEEIHDVVAMDAYEAVRVLRPEWLVPRSPTVIGQRPSEVLAVYLDDFRLGGVAELRGLSPFDIEAIRFVSAAEATARWGVGNTYGAIQVVTRD